MEEPNVVDDLGNVESGEEELLVFGPDFLIPVDMEEDMGDLNTCDSWAGPDNNLLTDDDADDMLDTFPLSVHSLGLALMASILDFSVASCCLVCWFPSSSLQFVFAFTKSFFC